MSDHDNIRELLGAYALDALDEHESIEVSAHLASCVACSTEIDEHHEITAMLANTGGDAPAHLWERIEAQLQLGTKVPGATAASPLVLADELAARRTLRGTQTRSVRRVVVAAAAAVVVLIGALAVEVGRLDDRVAHLQGATPQQQVARAAQGAFADPAAQHVVLAATTTSARLAQIAVLPTGAAFLVNDALPALPANRTYQLWGLVGDRLISLGLLGSDPSAVSFNAGGAGLVTRFAITAEHAGGVVQSTHQPVAVSEA